MKKTLSVFFVILLTANITVAQSTLVFEDCFDDFTNWGPASNNGSGCSWAVVNGWAKIATMGYSGSGWISAIYERNLPQTIPPGTDFTIKAHIRVMDGDPGSSCSGVGVQIMGSDDSRVCRINFNDSQAASGYGGLQYSTQLGMIYTNDPGGFSTNNPQFDGVLEVKREGITYTAYLDGNQLGSPVDYDITATALKVQITNGRYLSYGYRDGEIDSIQIWVNSTQDITPPAAPQNLTVTPDDQEIALTWSANTETDLAKYRIYRETTSPSGTLIDSLTGYPPSPYFTDAGLINGQTYYYRITAVDTADNESDFSEEVHIAPTVVPNDLIAYYPFNNNANDESGNGNDGTNNGANPTIDRFGNSNSAYQFDGIDDFMNLGNGFDFVNKSFSISIWDKHDTSSGMLFSQGTYANNKHLHIAYYNTGYNIGIRFYYNDLTAEVPEYDTVNWHHWGFTYDASTRERKIYLNGSIYDQDVASANYTGSGDLFLGAGFAGGGYYPGKLDDINIYDRAINESEILQLYANYFPPDTLIAKPSDKQVALSWDPTGWANLEKVYVFRDHNLVDSVEVTCEVDTVYIDIGLTNEQLYDYKIQSKDIYGNLSIFSDTISVAPTVVPDGLIAWYPFNNNANDESGNGNDGTENGGVTLTTDRFGNANSAYSFDGVDDNISIPESFLPIGNTTRSLSVWINQTDIYDNAIFQYGNNSTRGLFRISIATGNLDVRTYNDDHLSDTVLNKINKWYHLCIIYKGNNEINFYLNGKKIDTYILGGDLNTSIGYYSETIGASGPSGSSDNFSGKIDDVRIYNRALSESEISQFYSNYYPPDTLIAKPGDKQVTLTWDSSGWSNLEKVYIFRDHNLIDSVQVTSEADTVYIDTGLTNGQSYDYKIQSKDIYGNLSIFSDTLSVALTVVLPEGLVAYYPFNGNANDKSGNGNDGTVNGAVLITDRFGNANSAYSFDGVDDYIATPVTKAEHQDFTINVWAKGILTMTCSKTSAYESYFGCSADSSWLYYHLGWYESDMGLAGDVSAYGDLSVNYNMFTVKGFATGTDSYKVQLYVNSNFIDEKEVPYKVPFWQYLEIGRNVVEHNGLYNGKIDDIRIYNRTLTQSEILQLYANYYPPDTLIAKPGDKQVTLSWDSTGWSNLEKVYILKDHVTIDSVQIISEADTLYIDTGLTNGQSYDYKIRSKDIYGNLSIFSDTVSVAPTVILDSLFAWYPFNGNANDMSGNGFHGTENGGVALTTDRFGNSNSAYSFDGTDDYISTLLRYSDHFAIGDSIQFSCWFKTNHNPTISSLILGGDPGNGPEFVIALLNGGKVLVRLYGCDHQPISDQILNDDKWHHISFGYSGGNSNFYVDGIRQSDSLSSLGTYVNNDLLWFGARNAGGISNQFEGKIDDFRIYNRALTESEIDSLYHEGEWSVDSLSLEFDTTNTSSIGGTDGSIDLTVNGGVTPYSYSWSNGANTEDIFGLTAGVYSITVTDTRDSTATDSIRIYDTFVDERDTQVYKAVTIGSQVWMAENLNVGTYAESINTGSSHSDVSDNSIIEKYCYENNETYCDTFGGLYDWNEMMQYNPSDNGEVGTTQGVCPDGWHIPTDTEWATLVNYLGGESVAGGKLKETGITHWYSPNTDATNESGFSALPAGVRYSNGLFYKLDTVAYFWSATKYGGSFAWFSKLYNDLSTVYRGYTYETRGNSVSCVKDICTSIELIFITTNVTCNGGNDGTIDLTVSGGTPPFVFNWSNGEYTEDINGLVAGKYYVTVTDNSSCITVDSVTITEPDPLSTLIIDSSNISCYGFTDGSATITSSGGTAPYTYLWDDLQNTTESTITGLSAGMYYHVTITDAHNCTITDSVILSEPDPLTTLIIDSTDISCYGFSDGSVTITPTGGIPPYTYLWDDPANTTDSIVTGLSANQYYHVTVTDANNCVFTDSVILSEPGQVPAPETNDVSVCYGNDVPDMTAIGTNIKWYSDPQLSVLEHTGSPFSTGDTALNIYTYYVTQTVDNCEGLSDTVTLSILYCISDYHPYLENFENGKGGWFEGTNSSWEWGVPDGPTINSAVSGEHAWVTNLSGDYNNNELSFVYSPVFNFDSISEPYISMSIWYDCQYGFDGANFQYSKDNGKTWHVIGDKYDNEMEGWNWYNNDNIAGLFAQFCMQKDGLVKTMV